MTSRQRKAKESLLNDKIDILNGFEIVASPAGRVFRAVSAILAVVRVGASVFPFELSLMARSGQDDREQ